MRERAVRDFLGCLFFIFHGHGFCWVTFDVPFELLFAVRRIVSFQPQKINDDDEVVCVLRRGVSCGWLCESIPCTDGRGTCPIMARSQKCEINNYPKLWPSNWYIQPSNTYTISCIVSHRTFYHNHCHQVWPPNWQPESDGIKELYAQREKEIMAIPGGNERWENWLQFTQSRLVPKFTPMGFKVRKPYLSLLVHNALFHSYLPLLFPTSLSLLFPSTLPLF